MAKIRTPEALGKQEEARERVRWILDTVFGGRQRRMAEAMKVPQSQISRIINGQLGVSVDFLDAMGRLPAVNPEWVRAGIGEPMLPPTKGTLPVALGVLPGLPLDIPHLLTGYRHPVATSLERETRYWLELQPGSPLVRDASLRMSPGDLLLMEAAWDWTTRLEYIIGRLCGVRLAAGLPDPAYVLGKISQDPLGLILDVIDGFTRVAAKAETQPRMEENTPSEPSTREAENAPKREKTTVRRRVRNLDDEERKARLREQKRAETVPVNRVEGQDVLCVCIYLVRPAPGSTPAV